MQTAVSISRFGQGISAMDAEGHIPSFLHAVRISFDFMRVGVRLSTPALLTPKGVGDLPRCHSGRSPTGVRRNPRWLSIANGSRGKAILVRLVSSLTVERLPWYHPSPFTRRFFMAKEGGGGNTC